MPSTSSTELCGHCRRPISYSIVWYIQGKPYHLGACSIQKSKWLTSDPGHWDEALARAEAVLAALCQEAFEKCRDGWFTLDTARNHVRVARQFTSHARQA